MGKSDERESKLPVWAQELIVNLRRERDTAVRELRSWTDQQTPSPFSIFEYVCDGEEERGPSAHTRYVQTRRIKCDHAGVSVEVSVKNSHPRRNDACVEVRLGVQNSSVTEEVGLFAVAFNQFEVRAIPRNVAHVPHEES